MSKRLSQEELIKKSIIIHNNFYDYSKVDYKSMHDKVIITCPIHGDFEQAFNEHLKNNKGCKKCAIEKRKLTEEEFIQKAINIHTININSLITKKIDIKIFPKNKQYYEDKLKKVLILGETIKIDPNILPTYSKQKIDVKCIYCGKENSIMWKTFIRSNKNYCCKDCKSFKIKENLLVNSGVTNVFQLEYIKEKSKKTLKEKYDVDHYSKTEEFKLNNSVKRKDYIKNNSDFKEKLIDNISDKKEKIKRTTREKHSKLFLKRTTNSEYDYSKVEYVDMNTKVTIICPVHGEFEQKPKEHIHNKNGCPICKSSKGEKEIRNYLNINNIKYEFQKKFEGCKNKRSLPFDFYLPDTDVCIEYDGEQHFKVVEAWGGEEGLKIRQERDEIKTKYCKDNDIKLIRIRFDENIEEKLKSEIL